MNRLRKNSLTVVPLVLLFLIVVSAQQQKAQQAFPNLGIDIATSNGSLYIPASVNGKTLGAQGGLSSSTDISGSVGSGLIALTLRDQNGKLQIFTITPDGRNKRQLTFEGENGRPDWSPDGQKIVFMSMRDGKLWVAVMDADGSNQKLLVEGLSPDWSPDGKQIAFSRPDDKQIVQIWVVNADGSNIRQITQSNTVKIGPSWSPDGKEMVFILLKNPGSSADSQPEIGIMNSDGTNERILTVEDRINTDDKGNVCEPAPDANAPAWSPVDNRIAFWSGIENQYGQIWVINSDGTGSKQLTHDCSHRNSDDPSWSPDGKKILFSTGRSGRNELWVMDADGQNERKVYDIDAAPFPGRASWQPVVPKAPGSAETKYLTFQVQTGYEAWAGPRPRPGRVSLDKAQLEEFVHSLTKAIGTTGDKRNKLAFAIGPLCFDMPDDETRQFIRDAFAVARENDVAVVLHIDDSMAWGRRKELISNPANIETADWRQIPNTGRRLDWGKTPTKFPPQMCFNAPAIIAAVTERGKLIGEETKKQMDALKAAGKEHLFGGILAGWETRIGRDFDTDKPLGFRALSHRGFSEKKPPKDDVQERANVVKEFMELWANALHAPGVPREKIYCHIAFTAQGLDHKEKTQTVSTFALPEVAFSRAYRPGFSTYPEGASLKEIQGHVAAHGSPAWVSAETTNVSPSGIASGLTMETFLGRHFNHGAVMVNLFAWQMGGEAMKDNFFRRAIEGPEALAAYGKFLRGEKLVESAAQGFSSEVLEAKMQRIQKELPEWIQKSGKQAQAMPLVQKMQALTKEKKWQEVDKVADEILALISSGEKK